MGFAVVKLVGLLNGVEHLLRHTGKVEGSVRSIAGSGPSAPSITTPISAGPLAQEWVADGSEGEEDNDGSKSEEKSSAQIKGKSGIGITVGIMAGVGVVMVLLGVASSTGGLICKWGLVDLTFCPHTGKKEECEG